MSDLDRGCTCTLPEDWGSGGGWHMKPVSRQYATKHKFADNMIGQPIAVEPCPHFRAVIRKKLEDEKRRQTSTDTRPRIRSES